LHGVAIGGDDRAIRRQPKRSVSGITGRAVRQRDLKIAFALNCHIQCVGCLGQRTLLIDGVNRSSFDAQSDLGAGGDEASGIGTIGSDAPQVLIHQVLKFGPLALVPGGGQVGDVVGYDFDVCGLGLHARARDIKRPHGSGLPFKVGHFTKDHFRMAAGQELARVLSIVDWMRSSSA
jgi:hypothetical protein